MNLSLSELYALLGVSAPTELPSIQLTGFASLSEAKPGDISFLGNPKYAAQLPRTQASVVLVPENAFTMHQGAFQKLIPVRNVEAGEIPVHFIECPNPSASFALVVQAYAKRRQRISTGIHPSAVIDESAVLGEGVSIAAGVVIGPRCKIGDRAEICAGVVLGEEVQLGEDVILHPNVTVREFCTLGNRVVIHPNTVIGSDGFGYEMIQGRHVKIDQVGVVRIEDDVEIGSCVTVDRARFGATVIGEGSKIDNLVQIAHNVVIGKHCIVVAQTGIAGSTKLGNYVTLAAQVGVAGHLEIGDQAIVAAQSGVAKSIPAKEVYFATPAVPMKEAREMIALQHRLPKLLDRLKALEKEVKTLKGCR